MTEDAHNTGERNPRWSSLTAAILAGWNVGLLTTIVLAIGLSVGLRDLFNVSIGNTLFLFVVGVSLVLGSLTGVVIGQKWFSWFSQRKRFTGYVWVAVLLLLTVMLFPAPFSFRGM